VAAAPPDHALPEATWAECYCQTGALEPENATTEDDVDRMEVLSGELRKFGEDVEAGQI
jgi:hypothetical protein